MQQIAIDKEEILFIIIRKTKLELKHSSQNQKIR